MWRFMEGSAQAAEDVGIRATLAPYTADRYDYFGTLETNRRLLETHRTAADGRVRSWVGLEHIFYCSADMFRDAAALAEEFDTGIHTHSSESIWEVQECLRQFGRRDPLEHPLHVGIELRILEEEPAHLDLVLDLARLLPERGLVGIEIRDTQLRPHRRKRDVGGGTARREEGHQDGDAAHPSCARADLGATGSPAHGLIPFRTCSTSDLLAAGSRRSARGMETLLKKSTSPELASTSAAVSSAGVAPGPA